MADSCSTCFFAREDGDIYRCHHSAPSRIQFGAAQETTWPPVDPNDWCGDGADKNTYHSFTPSPAQ